MTLTLQSNHTSRLAWDIAVAPPKSLYDVDKYINKSRGNSSQVRYYMGR